jgi:hypothetical protein
MLLQGTVMLMQTPELELQRLLAIMLQLHCIKAYSQRIKVRSYPSDC